MKSFERRVMRLEHAHGLGLVFPSILLVLANQEERRACDEWAQRRFEGAGDPGPMPEVHPARSPSGNLINPDDGSEIPAELETAHTLLIMQDGPTEEIMALDNVVCDGLPAPGEQV
jgi:hypothetical protein